MKRPGLIQRINQEDFPKLRRSHLRIPYGVCQKIGFQVVLLTRVKSSAKTCCPLRVKRAGHLPALNVSLCRGCRSVKAPASPANSPAQRLRQGCHIPEEGFAHSCIRCKPRGPPPQKQCLSRISPQPSEC